MPGSISRDDAQAMTAFTFEPVNQTPRFFVSEFGCFTTAIAEHRPILILKIAGHNVPSFPSPLGRGSYALTSL